MTDIDPELFGKEIGNLIADAIQPLAERLAELELLVKGVDRKEVNRLAAQIRRGDRDD